MSEAKPYNIPKQLVWKAYRQVKANRGAAGVDGQWLAAFEENLEDSLYKIWNRMASGSYFPPPVEDLARLINPSVRGWLNYYGRFYRSRCVDVLSRHFKQTLTAWARRKFKRLRGRKYAPLRWLECLRRRDPKLFALWELAAQPQGWIIGAG